MPRFSRTDYDDPKILREYAREVARQRDEYRDALHATRDTLQNAIETLERARVALVATHTYLARLRESTK